MTCKQNKKEESYEFFENIVNYIDKAKSAESNAEPSNAVSECNSFMETSGSYFTVEETAKRICQQYVKLYNSLTDCKINSSSNPNYQKCRDFLNYWVNFKLIEIMKKEYHSVINVHGHLESQITFSNLGINIVCIHDINKDDLYKMNILYRLYKNYTDLDTILESRSNTVKKTSLSLSTACCKDYLEARYICDTSKNNSNSPFCNKLNDFKSKYDKLDDKFVREPSEISDYLIKLSECPNTKIISTAVTGTVVGLIPLLGVLYKVSELNINL
ncbi:hypothetical protein PVBG_06218 [Plasmodium vivax Brazil I]|uniref:Variable surface protein Vir7-like protein n=1 Tax=Plasmodium vivax (strain Brazil I) TaxID=1033975 RepID=A0A0J9T2G4_PLAV1|nr:hypothetical protein PVBG_06218 [Plasmodium vivax Brazil I]